MIKRRKMIRGFTGEPSAIPIRMPPRCRRRGQVTARAWRIWSIAADGNGLRGYLYGLIPGERHRRAASGYRTRGRDAATFQIVLGNAFAAGFSGLALARCGRR